MSKIINKNTQLIITDFNVLPNNIDDFWMNEYTENYLVYDKANRFNENKKIKHQKNVGANIYDIFYHIYHNYNNLPEILIFCKSNVIPRHCGEEKFKSIINNSEFTTIENYIREAPKYKPGIYAFVDDSDGYHENPIEVDSTVNSIHQSKHIFKYKDMIMSIFENPTFGEYIRFAPGGNHIIPKKNILKYNRFFYKTLMEYTDWAQKPGEAYILERAMYTLFNNNFIIKEKYRN